VELLILSSADVDELLDREQLLEAVAEALIALSSGATSVPPRIAAVAPGGMLAAMPGFVAGVALETKLVSVFPGNHSAGLPSHQALIVVFDEHHGTPIAVMDGTVITAHRTAAASALSVRALADPGATRVAILGAGVQGAAHLDALARLVGPEVSIRIASRSHARAAELASRHRGSAAADSFEEAVRDAEIVCLCTDASEPVIRRDWLTRGAHVTSVGASRGGPEVDAATVTAATVFVESRVAVQPYPAGAHELRGLDPGRVVELGEVLGGTHPGRTSVDQLTLYKSMGHAVEDAAAAALVLRRARATGRGTLVGL